VRICLVYDCLYPYTVGGAERWYRNLGERLAADGHAVTYLTLRQWESGSSPDVPGVDVVTVGPRLELYANGRRRIVPPLVFGAGVLRHLAAHGRRYDVVHTASFPYFSLLAAAALRPRGDFRLVVDWHEVWTPAYWREYLGRVGGRVGWSVQQLCVRAEQRAFCFSELHARRLREYGLRGEVTVLRGQYEGDLAAAEPRPVEPVVVFAGRQIPEKRVLAVVPAVARARAEIPGLRCVIFGAGPDRGRLLRQIAEYSLAGAFEAPGFVAAELVDRAIRQALCLLLPSRREGYGRVVVEAAARATPSIVVAGPDNAAVELVEDGVNGAVSPSASADDLAAAIVRVHRAGLALRESTAAWFDRESRALSLDASLEVVSAAYAGRAGPRAGGVAPSL
jgi:glycosyltransferase involved in cell wall biosynthesis